MRQEKRKKRGGEKAKSKSQDCCVTCKPPKNFAFSPPLFFRFSCLIFFSLAGHLVGFILVGRVFRKAFRILGIGERKGSWVMEQDFHGDFQVNVTWFFASFSGVLD